METKEKKQLSKPLKIIIIVVSSIIGFFVVALGGLNLFKFAYYSEYFSAREVLCTNPGLNEDYVPQGTAVYENENLIITSGYMKDKSASRLYITDFDDNDHYVKLQKNGKDFTGHVGGIAIGRDMFFIANNDRYYTLPLETILNAEPESYIEIGEGTKVNNQASFIYSDDQYLYVGEFHDGKNYITENKIETEDGDYYAIVEVFSLDDLNTRTRVYSIRNKVQGFCQTPDGRIVLSTSYGLTDSVFYVYESEKVVDSGTTYLDAPLYILDSYSKAIKGPAMSEDLDYYNGKIVTQFESACNKYIFGKFFFANKVVALDI